MYEIYISTRYAFVDISEVNNNTAIKIFIPNHNEDGILQQPNSYYEIKISKRLLDCKHLTARWQISTRPLTANFSHCKHYEFDLPFVASFKKFVNLFPGFGTVHILVIIRTNVHEQ